MKCSADVEVDLEDFSTRELAEALFLVAGDKEAAHRCVSRIDEDAVIRREGRRTWRQPEQEHARELRALREEVRAALELIDAGRKDEGMRALRLFAAEEIRLTEWQRVKEGRHPFLKIVAA